MNKVPTNAQAVATKCIEMFTKPFAERLGALRLGQLRNALAGIEKLTGLQTMHSIECHGANATAARLRVQFSGARSSYVALIVDLAWYANVPDANACNGTKDSQWYVSGTVVNNYMGLGQLTDAVQATQIGN